MSTNSNTNGYGDNEYSGEHRNEISNQHDGVPGTSDHSKSSPPIGPEWEPLQGVEHPPPPLSPPDPNGAYGPPSGNSGYEPPRNDERGNNMGGCGLMVVGAFTSAVITFILFFLFMGANSPQLFFLSVLLVIITGIYQVIKGKDKAFGWGIIMGPPLVTIIGWGACVILLTEAFRTY